MATVQRLRLNCLQLVRKNSLIVGIIISKQETRVFQAKNAKFGPGERGVWKFTLRDTEADFANVTVWGSRDYIEGLAATFRIGQVVELMNPTVTLRHKSDKGEMYVPSVSSQFNIALYQGTSKMFIHNSPDRARYIGLLALPTKNLGRIKSLDVVLKNIEQIKDEHVDVMVTLMSMSLAGQMPASHGRTTVYRDIDVNDGSIATAVTLRLWGSDWVKRAQSWQPRHTVLLLADVLVAFHSLKRETLLTIGMKTLITENPNVSQAEIVRAAALNLADHPPSSDVSTQNASSFPNFTTIRGICEKMEQSEPNSEKIPFTAVIGVIINQVDLKHKSVLTTKCALCEKLIYPDQKSCMNRNCPCGNGTRIPVNVTNFNLKLTVSDDTGRLVGCRLVGAVAEKFLKCTVQEFKMMSSVEREKLSRDCILAKCSIRIQVIGPTASSPSLTYNVLTIDRLPDNAGSVAVAGSGGLYS